MSIASALSESHEVDLFFPNSMDEKDLIRLLPDFSARPKIRRTPPTVNVRVLGELQAAVRNLAYGATLVQSTYVPGMNLSRRGFLLCEFPFMRRLSLDDALRLRTYTIIANSNFTAEWIRRRWKREAVVLHPPVVPIAPREKRPYILAIGRFVAGGRSKRQLELVQMFRSLVEGGLSGWELHLAGFVQDKDYLRRVREEAEGLPVVFHLNVSRNDLETLIGASSIFWHAVGMGIDPEREPNRLEHFGIVTVEAMSAGCVPIVIRRGGQPEIVQEAGILWDTPEQCLEATLQMAQNDQLRYERAEQARSRAECFYFQKFKGRVLHIFEGGSPPFEPKL